MTTDRSRPRSRTAAFGDLFAAVSWNLPVILAAFLLSLRHSDLTLLGGAYAGTVVLGYYGLPLLVAVALIFILTLPVPRAARPLAVAVTTAYTGFLFVDAIAYQVIKFHIDSFWIEYLFTDIKGLGLPASTLVSAAVGLLLLTGLQMLIFRLAARARRPRFLGGILAIVLVLALGVGQVVHIVAYARNDARITGLTPLFPFYMPFTSHSNADRYGDMLPLDMREATQSDDGDRSFVYPHGALAFADSAAPATPDILVIMLESWRPDMMNAEVSPNIYRLAQRSLVFDNHVSTGNQTTCGIFGFFYGLHATYWPAVKANSASIHNPVLIDAIIDRGYTSRVLARSKFERHKISDTIFRDIDVVGTFDGRTVDVWDRDLTNQLKTYMSDNTAAEKPWFAYAFYKSTHFSYEYPDSLEIYTPTADLNLALVDQDTPVEPILNDYRNAMHYNDLLIGEVLDQLEAAGRLDDTVIIVTSDHGDELNDNHANYWGHGTNFGQWQVKVPLIVHLPGVEPAVVTERTSHMDVAPTLLAEVFGCTTDPAVYSTGVNMLRADLAAPRPFVIGSYINYAYLFGDDVFAIYPMHTRKHRFDDVKADAGRPPADLMRRALEEMGRFATPNDVTKDVK